MGILNNLIFRRCGLLLLCMMWSSSIAAASITVDDMRRVASTDLAVTLELEPITDIVSTSLRGSDVRALVHRDLERRFTASNYEALIWAGLRYGTDRKDQLTGIMVQQQGRWQPLNDARSYTLATTRALTLPSSPYPVLSTFVWKSVAIDQ